MVRAALAALAAGVPLVATAAVDPTQLSIEELFEVKVYSASKYEQKTTEAPGSITVITADEIRLQGWRTLADVLRSVRGLYVTYDRNYSYLGVRGFARMGDYNSRVLLLVDGYRLNEPVYDSALIGTEFPLDLDLVDRIEVVRGPGSSVYGSNAFFGVVNVITRSGGDLQGAEAAAAVQSFGTDAERVSVGGRTAGGVEWLASTSRYRSRGQDLYFAEFDDPATHDGLAQGLDGDAVDQAFSKVSYAGFTLMDGYSRRSKDIPTASYTTRNSARPGRRASTRRCSPTCPGRARPAAPGSWRRASSTAATSTKACTRRAMACSTATTAWASGGAPSCAASRASRASSSWSAASTRTTSTRT
jgi:outer membrane receptor protein involved in Fe transport